MKIVFILLPLQKGFNKNFLAKTHLRNLIDVVATLWQFNMKICKESVLYKV